jgi:TatD DNase family protein
MAQFFDTHAHLDFDEFQSDLSEVLQRARGAGIDRILSVGTDLAASRRAVSIAASHEGVFAVAGWHPGDAAEAPSDIRIELRALASHPRVVAIGECGLDFHRLPSRMGQGTVMDDERIRERQAALFVQQLEVASELGLNVVIHTRDSFRETVDLFRPYASRVRAVFHCFVGTRAEMEEVLGLGSLVSYTGIVTFKNGSAVRETLAATPLDGFMLETDCPFLAPVPHRGQRCEPAFISDIASKVAEVRGCSLEQLSAATCTTARKFFAKLD